VPDEVLQFVRHSDVPDYEALGWIKTEGLKGTHHGFHSEIMKWPHPEKPPARPQR